MARRPPTVEAVTTVAELSSGVYRNDLIPDTETGALSVLAAEPGLLDTLGGSMADGRSLDTEADATPWRCSARSPWNGWESAKWANHRSSSSAIGQSRSSA